MMDHIYLDDCLEGLKNLPDNCVDLCITDPPYLFDTRGAGFHKRGGCCAYDYFDEIGDNGLAQGFQIDVLKETERVLKATNTYAFCNKNLLLPILDFYKDKLVDVLVWHKTNTLPIINNKYMSDVEYIVYARDKGVPLHIANTKVGSKVYTSVMNTKDKNKWHHPTIKPLPLIERFVRNSSKQGDIILDPFLGSGTTAVAAIRNRRHYIGFEISPKYYEIAQRRIDACKAMNNSLFD